MLLFLFVVAVFAQENIELDQGSKDMLFSAITNSDPDMMRSLAEEYSLKGETIRDRMSPELIELFLGSNKPRERDTRLDILNGTVVLESEIIERLGDLEDWASQVDQGVDFVKTGALDELFNHLLNPPDHLKNFQVLKAVGRVLVAALQNNDKAQEEFLNSRPTVLTELAEAMNFETPWILSTASALLRRSPEIFAPETVKDEVFKLRLETLIGKNEAPEWLKSRGQDLLEFLD